MHVVGLQECQHLIQNGSGDRASLHGEGDDHPYRLVASADPSEEFTAMGDLSDGEWRKCLASKAGVLFHSELAPQYLDQRIGTRYAVVAFESFVFASVYLPHKGTFGKNAESEWKIVDVYQRILRHLALDCKYLQQHYHIKHLIVAADANVEVLKNSFHGPLQISGEGVLAEEGGGRGGYEKRARAIRRAMSEALVSTMGVLGLQLSNTFGTSRSVKEEGVTTWRSTRGYEHVYDYLAVPACWKYPDTHATWLTPQAAKKRSDADTLWSDHKLLSLKAPAREDIQVRRFQPAQKSFKKWALRPGVAGREAAAIFDQVLLPCTHPFRRIEEEELVEEGLELGGKISKTFPNLGVKRRKISRQRWIGLEGEWF